MRCQVLKGKKEFFARKVKNVHFRYGRTNNDFIKKEKEFQMKTVDVGSPEIEKANIINKNTNANESISNTCLSGKSEKSQQSNNEVKMTEKKIMDCDKNEKYLKQYSSQQKQTSEVKMKEKITKVCTLSAY